MPQIELIKIIKVEKENCVNCHACITACPVKFCNDGSGDYVTVNQNMCLACGNCIKACTHNARIFIDDFDALLADLEKGEKIIAIAAPSVAANFPDNYLNLNGWLHSIGIEGVFDVSFGAELTVKTYLEYIKNYEPQTVIAQPCPAIVTYIQIYEPELLQYLAPADSPMVHTMKMIKEFYYEYKNYKIAVISPCNAKKREYLETGYGDYNVSFVSINQYFEKNIIDLSKFPEIDYLNPPAERAVMFSSPGGLLETAERWLPEIKNSTRKIEGTNIIYEYLEKLPQLIEEKKTPLLIDCLNCDNGCNAGPLTLNTKKSIDEIEFWIKRRNNEIKEKFLKENEYNQELAIKNIQNTIEKYWKPDLYCREYKNLSENNTIKYPNKKELKEIYKLMHKHTDKDIYNCSACGYGSCEQMATAIFNKLNRPENCHFYLTKETEIAHQKIIKSQKRLHTILSTTVEGFFQIDLDGFIVDSNKAMNELLEKDCIKGKHIFDFLDPENKRILAKQIKLREKFQNSVYEIVFTSSTGKKIFCSVSGTTLKNEEGKRIGSFAMVSDITELKTYQEELQNINTNLEEIVQQRTSELNDTFEELKAFSEQIIEKNQELKRLSIVASNTNNVVIILDAEGNFEWFNDAFADVYGYSFNEFTHLKGNNIFEASNNQRIKEIFENCKKTIKSVTYESKNLTKNSKVIWTQTNLTPITEDEAIINFVIIETDITEMKLAHEEILNQREEILNQREELLAQRDEILEKSNKLQESYEILKISEEKLKTFNSEILKQKEEIEKKNLELDEIVEELRVTTEIIEATNEELEEKNSEIEEKNQLLEQNQLLIIEKNNELQKQKDNILKFNELLKKQQKDILKANRVLEKQKQEIEEQKDELISQRDLVTSQRDKIAHQNKEIKDSIEYAKRIQEALLTIEKNINIKDYFIFYRPKDIVSGDFFWIKRFFNYTLIAVADCTGHGVPGGFMSMLGISILNEISAKHFRKISKIKIQADNFLNDLRANLIKILHQDKNSSTKDGMDIAFCILDTDTKIVQYAGAYNPLVIIRNKEIIEYKADKMPIGIHLGKENSFTNHEIQLFENDKLFMFSDGYVDQFGGLKKRKFLKNKFYELLLEIEDNSMDAQKELLESFMNTWMGDIKQTDDMLVLGFEI